MIRWGLLLLIFQANLLLASAEIVPFSDESLRPRYQQLIEELRCPKCQNQNLADSNSPISQDLRAEVQRLLELGMTNPEIEQYLTARYSEFILYRPHVNNNTYLLWLAPIVILLIGMAIVFGLSRRPKAVPQVQRDTTQTEQQRLAELLKDGNK